MVVVADLPLVESPIARLVLMVERDWTWRYPEAVVEQFVATVKAVGSEEQAIKLRLAQLLAWCKCRDVSEAGYPSWTAFAKEHAHWKGSRMRDYLRLVESPLDVIKRAASGDQIDLTIATRAARELGNDASIDAQVAWLLRATLEPVTVQRHACMERISGDQMLRIRKARELAQILIGWRAPMRAIDDFLFDCHVRKLTGEQILERARAVPPKPERLDKPVPEWKNDPSLRLLGPWIEPRDIHDAVAKLRVIEKLLHHRRAYLGIAYQLIREHRLWKRCGFNYKTLEDFCFLELEVEQRTFQRYAHEGEVHEWYPMLRKEISAGRLTVDRANFAVDHASIDRSLQRWLELVNRLGRAEMEHADEQQEAFNMRLRAEYTPALELARDAERTVAEVQAGLEATQIGGTTEAADVRAVGGATTRIAQHLLAVGARGKIQVALRDTNRRSRRRDPESIFVERGLLAAADYLLSVVELPKESGARKVVVHDRYTCQNPRCRRRTLRVHHHHLEERQHGGSDDPWNVITLCPACHLRLIHSNRMSVVRIDDWLLWTWTSGGTVLMHSPVDELTWGPP